MTDWSSYGWKEVFYNLNADPNLEDNSNEGDYDQSDSSYSTIPTIKRIETAENIADALDRTEKAARHTDNYFTSLFSDYCKALEDIKEEEDVWVLYQEQAGELKPIVYADERGAYVHPDFDPEAEIPSQVHPFSLLEKSMEEEDLDDFMGSIIGYQREFPDFLDDILTHDVEGIPNREEGVLSPEVNRQYVGPGLSRVYQSQM